MEGSFAVVGNFVAGDSLENLAGFEDNRKILAVAAGLDLQ